MIAEVENFRLLSDEIGVDIKYIQTEAIIGRYNVDILAEEENTERKKKSAQGYKYLVALS